MTTELHIMVGIPAAGKSTFIKQEEREKVRDGLTVGVISRDEVRQGLLTTDDEYFDREKEVFEEFVRQINESMEVGIDVVYVDATHINPKSRAKLLRRLKPDARSQLIIDYFPVTLALAKERNGKRTGFSHVPDSAIADMYRNSIPPTQEEFRKQAYYGFNGVRIVRHEQDKPYFPLFKEGDN